MFAILGASAFAAGTIELVGTESKSVTSTVKVTAKYTWRYYLASGSGMSTYTDYVTCNSTSPTQNGDSDVTKTATFTGKKFTPNMSRCEIVHAHSAGMRFSSCPAPQMSA